MSPTRRAPTLLAPILLIGASLALAAPVLTLLAPPALAQAPAPQPQPQPRPQAAPQTRPPPRLANPSAEFCVQRLGGTFEIEREVAGERGICVLRDGRRMDAWALFRAYHRDAPDQDAGTAPSGKAHVME